MTVAIFQQKGDHGMEIVIKGHAGFNPQGLDIVCAACSVLAYTLLERLMQIDDEGGLTAFSSSICEDVGECVISFQGKQWAHCGIKATIDTIITGFALLQKKYPDFVKLYVRSGEK